MSITEEMKRDLIELLDWLDAEDMKANGGAFILTRSRLREAAMSSAPTPPATAVSERVPDHAWKAFLEAYDTEMDLRPRESSAAMYEGLLAAIRSLAPVPAREAVDDWVLVPREITTDMMGAYHHAKRVFDTVPEIWTHILAAARKVAPVPAREAVKVKALEWSTDGAGLWQATCPHTYLNYAVLTRSSGLVEWRGSFDWHDALSIEAGKRCAQSDHEQRVLSALFRTTEEEG